MTRIRDIARILGRSENTNTNNSEYITEAPFDSAEVTTLVRSEAAPIVKYDSIGALPTTGLTSGDRALVENSDSNSARFYISNGYGWYNMALVNLSPSISLSPSGTITLSDAGATSTVTVTSSDSDNPDAIISYSIESDGNMVTTGTTVTQDSSVFTFDPLTADSGGVAGSFTLTFKASDGIGFTTATKDFSLTFIGTASLSPTTQVSGAAAVTCSSTTMAQSFVDAFNARLPSNNLTGINWVEFYNGSTNHTTAYLMYAGGQGTQYSEAGGPAYRSGSVAYVGNNLNTHWLVTGGQTGQNMLVDSIKIQTYTVSNGQNATKYTHAISG